MTSELGNKEWESLYMQEVAGRTFLSDESG